MTGSCYGGQPHGAGSLRRKPARGDHLIRIKVQIRAGTPDHPITIVPADRRVRVTFAGRTIADSGEALLLVEASLAPVYYVPPEHVDFDALERTEHRTRCPYKGEASYYSIRVAGRTAQNAVWCYEQPIEAVAAIAGYLAFYPERVDNVELIAG